MIKVLIEFIEKILCSSFKELASIDVQVAKLIRLDMTQTFLMLSNFMNICMYVCDECSTKGQNVT